MKVTLRPEQVKRLFLEDMGELERDEFALNLGRVMNSLEEGGMAEELKKRDLYNMVTNLALFMLLRMNSAKRDKEIDPVALQEYMNKPGFASEVLTLATWIGAAIQLWAPLHVDELK